MFFLYPTLLGLLIAIIVMSSNHQQEIRKLRNEMEQRVRQRDQQWRTYIESFKSRVETDREKSFIDRLLRGDSGKSAQPTAEPVGEATHVDNQQPAQSAATPQVATTAAYDTPTKTAEPSKKLDNALLLLYLGAFLFVVAAGLFVGFADFSGGVRTMVVALVAALFYSTGLYLYSNRVRLQPAGISFAAIGMAIAPLIGLSLYSYVFNETNGALIWFITSIVVFAMYFHAMYVLRSGFVSYLLILSFVSMMQSTVSIIDAPVYYFIWSLILTGLILKIASHKVKSLNLPELKEPAHVSSQVIVPLSIFASLVNTAEQGALQLAITFVFASVFYGLSAVVETGKLRASLMQTCHIFGLLALVTGVYDYRASFTDVAISLLIVTALHTGVVLLSRGATRLYDLGTTALIATLPMVLLAFDSSVLLLSSLIAMIIFGLSLAYRQDRVDGYLFTTFAIGFMPYVIGLRIITPALDAGPLALLSLSAPLALIGLRSLLQHQNRYSWLKSSTVAFVLASVLSIVPAILAEASVISFAVVAVLAGMYAWLAKAEGRGEWATGSGLVTLSVVVHALLLFTNPVLTISVLFALLCNIGLALYFRNELARWLGSILWFSVPLVLAVRGLDILLTATHQSWLFVLVLIGFVLARAIVRMRQDVAAKTGSLGNGSSYVVGYWAASFAALTFSLGADNVALQFSLISALLIPVFWVVSRYVEENSSILGVVPLLMQLFIFTLLQAIIHGAVADGLYIFCSTSVALVAYAAYKLEVSTWIRQSKAWLAVTLVSLFIAPATIFVLGETDIMMPIGLAVAGIVMLVENWRKRQGSREVTGFIIVAAIMWLMSYYGFDNVQAYTHVLALIFGVYALWRHALHNNAKVDEYLRYMFFIATIPLALQALIGTSGDLYGWLLIFQQVGFVLLGMIAGKKYLSKWGLYVTIGSVLYQMRELEWVVLGILAVSIIGAALYYLNHQNTEQ